MQETGRKPAWIQQHARRAHDNLRALTEAERREILAGVEATHRVEGIEFTDELREVLLAYARGDLSGSGFETWLVARVGRPGAPVTLG